MRSTQFCRTISMSGVAVLASACTSVTPPAPAPAPADAYVRANVDRTWPAIVQFFADTRIPISTIDKASGIVASKDFALTGDIAQRFLDCGTTKDGKAAVTGIDQFIAKGLARASGDFNVFVRPSGDSTAVRVNVGYRVESMNPMAYNRFTPVNCVTSGAFERDLVEYIRKNAR